MSPSEFITLWKMILFRYWRIDIKAINSAWFIRISLGVVEMHNDSSSKVANPSASHPRSKFQQHSLNKTSNSEDSISDTNVDSNSVNTSATPKNNLRKWHQLCLIWLYLGTKYEVCWWNTHSIRDMTEFFFFIYIFWKFDIDHVELYWGTKYLWSVVVYTVCLCLKMPLWQGHIELEWTC